MGGLQASFASHSSQLHPSLRLPAVVPRRPREAMPLSLAGNGVAGTLAATYRSHVSRVESGRRRSARAATARKTYFSRGVVI
eukprot:2380420-Prymnesium_polylepis.1